MQNTNLAKNDTEPAASVKSHWQLYPWGYVIEYALRKSVPSGKLLSLCQALVTEVLPLEAVAGKALTDIKGCNQPLELELLDGIASPPGTDELFYMKGCFVCEEENEEGEKEVVRKGFEYSITTPFLDFPGTHHIRHSSLIETAGAWPKDLKLAAVGAETPLEIHYLRLGLDFFRSRYITGMLGFAPSVWQSLIVEATDEEICFKVSAEGLPKRDYDLFQNDSAAGKLQRVLNRFFLPSN